MMQQVATTKSEFAAFATGAEASSQQDSTTNEQFGLLLKDHQNSHGKDEGIASSTNHKTDKPSSSHSHKPIKVNEDLSEKTSLKADGWAQENKANQTEERFDGAEKVNNKPLDEAATATTPEFENHDVSKVTKRGEHDVIPRDANTEGRKGALDSAALFLDSQVESELEDIDLEQWVDLVGNLQELTHIKSDVVQDLKHSNTKQSDDTKSLSKLILDSPEPSRDVTSIEIDGSIEVNEESLVNLESDVGETDKISVSRDLVQKIMGELEQDPSKNEMKQIVSQILETLKGGNESHQSSIHTDKPEELLGNTGLDRHSEIDVPDLTNDIDKALLIELLEENDELNFEETSTLEVEGVDIVMATTEKAKVPTSITSAKSEDVSGVEAEFSDGFEQRITSEMVTNELKEETSEIKLEDDVLIKATNFSLENKKSDVKLLLELPNAKLDKVMANISQRVIDSTPTSEAKLSEQNQVTAEQTVSTLVADVAPNTDLASKEFVAALKTGLQEFKSQLAQGREPGLDLKALVAEAATKVTDQSLVNKAAISADTTVNNVSQIIEFASSLSQAIEHNQNQSYNNYVRDVAQIQGEQSKQVQLNQVDTKYEKAINITKPEGHQQLAEKVRWMVNTKNLVADIRLDPAELGSVHVKVAMSGDAATVNFVVQSHHARDAVDSATPRLREMLADKGIELGQSSVRQESDNQQQEQGEFAGNNGSSEQAVEETEVPNTILSQQRVVNGALGGIDYFV